MKQVKLKTLSVPSKSVIQFHSPFRLVFALHNYVQFLACHGRVSFPVLIRNIVIVIRVCHRRRSGYGTSLRRLFKPSITTLTECGPSKDCASSSISKFHSLTEVQLLNMPMDLRQRFGYNCSFRIFTYLFIKVTDRCGVEEDVVIKIV